MGFTINETIKTELHYKDIALIADIKDFIKIQQKKMFY
jgi:hypothetical protein